MEVSHGAVEEYRAEHGRYPDLSEFHPFPHDGEKFMAAVRAFARKETTLDWFPKDVANDEAAFEEFVEFARNASIGKMLRAFHERYGRYPEYEEIYPPEGPRISLRLK